METMRTVALRKESVDRNFVRLVRHRLYCGSLSARRAWIEMHHGGIDTKHPTSLSARRAWIEIVIFWFPPLQISVALRKESVDRNSLLCRILFRR